MVSFSARAQTISKSSILCVAIHGSYGTNAFFCGLWSVDVFSAFRYNHFDCFLALLARMHFLWSVVRRPVFRFPL